MRRYIIVTIVLLLAIVLNYLPPSPSPVLRRKPLKDFPARIGDWTLVNQQKMALESLGVLKVDDYIMRTYANSKGRTVYLYIGWFKTQREGKTNHSPRLCLTGAGWYTVNAEPVSLPVTDNRQIKMNRYLVEKGSAKDLFLFWYQGRGRETASEYLTKAYLIWDSITKHRTDGALIRLSSTVTSDPDKTVRTEADFIRSFYPLISKFIPN